MSSFDGRLRLPGQAKLPLAVEIDVSQERMRLTAGEETVADWPLERLEVDARPDGFHITVDDEQVVLSVTDAPKFAKELNLPSRPPSRPVAPKANRKPPTEVPTAGREPRRGRRRNREACGLPGHRDHCRCRSVRRGERSGR